MSCSGDPADGGLLEVQAEIRGAVKVVMVFSLFLAGSRIFEYFFNAFSCFMLSFLDFL